MKINKETRQEIKMYQANDYDIGEETSEYIIMERKQKQSVVIHLILLFCTWGIGNLIYWLIKRKPQTKKIMK